jgi:hypothetical protein
MGWDVQTYSQSSVPFTMTFVGAWCSAGFYWCKQGIEKTEPSNQGSRLLVGAAQLMMVVISCRTEVLGDPMPPTGNDLCRSSLLLFLIIVGPFIKPLDGGGHFTNLGDTVALS